jgi:hypothetical protein
MSQSMESDPPATSPIASKITVVALGNSHIWALLHAALKPEAAELPYELKCLPFFGPKYQPYWLGQENVPNHVYVADVEKLIAEATPSIVLCFCASNFIYAYGTFGAMRAFDFVIPGREDLGLIPGAQVVPYNLMRDTASHAGDWWGGLLKVAVRLSGAAPVYSVCLPPPPADIEELLLRKSNSEMKSTVERLGVLAPALRYKMWHIQSDTDCQKAASVGAMFLPPPAKALDDAGFRCVKFSTDLLHGNPAYGELILKQLTDIVLAQANTES